MLLADAAGMPDIDDGWRFNDGKWYGNVLSGLDENSERANGPQIQAPNEKIARLMKERF